LRRNFVRPAHYRIEFKMAVMKADEYTSPIVNKEKTSAATAMTT
jgi:hypothetical protein